LFGEPEYRKQVPQTSVHPAGTCKAVLLWDGDCIILEDRWVLMMKSRIRIGSRGSRLAVVQAEIIRDRIQTAHPECELEIITMKTTGDKILGKSLEAIGGKGLFVKELDLALQDGRIDLAVHSLKDVPMELPEELPILAYGKREDPRDVLVYCPGLDGMPEQPLIGSSSRRRMLQIKALYPEAHFQGIRGNVQTRLKKLVDERMDATILAAAGLNRLQMTGLAVRYFSVDEMLPAAGQGILAVQGRRDMDVSLLRGIDDAESRVCAIAERAFIKELDGGCTSPIAAYGEMKEGKILLRGLYYREEDGSWFKDADTGEIHKAEELGRSLARRMRQRGCLK